MRHEFPQSVKNQALERSRGQCEASGSRYGLPDGVRCQRRIHKGRVHFDHWPRGAHDPSPETRTIGNCVATCPECNTYANNKHDTPREQKIKVTTYDHALHQARMDRKAGLDTPDPPKPRGRQGRKQPIRTRPTKWPSQKLPSRPMRQK